MGTKFNYAYVTIGNTVYEGVLDKFLTHDGSNCVDLCVAGFWIRTSYDNVVLVERNMESVDTAAKENE